jgi:NDP-sugar pyrophosphorylase family protein
MEREIFPRIAEAGNMSGLVFEGYFVDAGTPPSFIEAARVCILNNRFSTGRREGGNWFGDGSVCNGIVENCSIGKGVVISPGAKLSDSVILDGATVGEGANLESCIVGEGFEVPPSSKMVGQVVANSN